MPTRAERFKAEQERTAHNASRRTPKKKAPPTTDPDLPGVVGGIGSTDARRGAGHTAARNLSRRAGKKASVALEDSAKRPSRKSSRSGANRTKADTKLHEKALMLDRSPETRAAKANASKRQPRKI